MGYPAFCHVPARYVWPGLYAGSARLVSVLPDCPGQALCATESRTCAPGGRPSCCAASPALTASDISPALSVNATISPGATAANVSRYGTVRCRRPQRTTSGEPNLRPRRLASAAGRDNCTLPNLSTDITSPCASPSRTRLRGAGGGPRDGADVVE